MRDTGLLDLDSQFCFALYAAARRVVRDYAEALKPLDLTYPQYLVMLVPWAWARDGHSRPTVKALGERRELDSGTLTLLQRRLQEKGMVMHKRVSSDERELYLFVTTQGARLKRKVRAIPFKMVETCPLTLDQLVELRDHLKRFRSADAA